jgi:hypothetical protein
MYNQPENGNLKPYLNRILPGLQGYDHAGGKLVD